MSGRKAKPTKPSRKPRRIGRPSKLTPALQAKILKLIRAGNYIETACGAVGIDKATYHRWIERGEAGDQPFRDFRDLAMRARDEAETFLLEQIRKAAVPHKGRFKGVLEWDPKAAMFILERSRPDRWGKSEHHEVKHSGGVKVEQLEDLSALTDEELEQLRALRLKIDAAKKPPEG